MKITRVLSIFLLVLLLLNTLVLPCFATEESESFEASISEPASDPSPSEEPLVLENIPSALIETNVAVDFNIKATAAALIAVDTGTLAYGYELDKQIYPASLTKIMTCMLALEYGNLDDVVTVSATALQNLSAAGSTAGLLEGEKISLRDLLYCIMLSSANEGCNVIAEYVSGDIDSFLDLMNDYAAALGMKHTHFMNTHGLHDEQHYSTVRDLSILARWAWQNEDFRTYATATSHTVPATNMSDARTLHTTNYLISSQTIAKYYYSKASGIKTGFTTPAGACLISTASNGEMEFMSVVVGCSEIENEDGSTTDERFTETKRLLEYGLDHFSYVQVLSDTKMADMPPVLYAQGRENVVVHPKENLYALLPDTCDPAQIMLKTSYDSETPLEAPLEAGQRVGMVSAVYKGETLASCELVTLTAVERSTPKYVAKATGGVFSSFGDALRKLWFITVPVLLILVAVIAVLILRARDKRRAKRRAMRKRRPGSHSEE
ncbi:MAG: D-alanyl-D-alanine carboxypeptidase [Oscillospiraceae bacterium]|jgi:D-alanyl-D-alanine carboxypeptidase (penicillin-binding protein 5/6)|nr:D-alanyl-D-alanine carboxypeptidase [Oscillospiraceae bacterium]